jgi:hypothetical protein
MNVQQPSEMASSTEDAEFYYNQFLIFPQALWVLPNRESNYKIVATRKDNGKILGSSGPYYSVSKDSERKDKYCQLWIPLVRNNSLTKALEEDEIEWTVQGLLPKEQVVIEKPYLRTNKVKKYAIDTTDM